jgi:hypothetical protein
VIGRLKELIERWRERANEYNAIDVALPRVARAYKNAAMELEAASKPHWIPVGQQYPTKMIFVWVFNGEVKSGSWCCWQRKFIDAGFDEIDNVTHWVEIEAPDPPEVKP